MTRADIGGALQRSVLKHKGYPIVLTVLENQRVAAAVAELSKQCGNCEHFYFDNGPEDGGCRETPMHSKVPKDGSGFCHRWTPLPLKAEDR